MASQSAGTSEVARRYAQALYGLAEEQGALDKVADDLRTVQAMLEDSADLRRFVSSPMLGRQAQITGIAAIADKAALSDLVKNFLGLVARNRRLSSLSGMIIAFLDYLAKQRGEITAEVISAKKLTEKQTSALVSALKKSMGHDVSIDAKVDPAVLGGLVVKVGSRMVDSSLRTKLQRLQLAMKGVG